jgi:hypothetical protein
MTRSLYGHLFSVGITLSALAAVACKPGGVGDPCVPEDEYKTGFSGYAAKEVNIESRSFQCETRVCLVNHFQGRVSCPYGQSQESITSQAGASPLRCHVPNTTGEVATDQITVPVKAQIRERRPNNAVYCSARCANAKGRTDDGAKYYDCPSGFHCAQLIDDLKLGSAQLAGGYCIRNGTDYDPTASTTMCTRSTDGDGGNCGPAQPY